MRIVYLNNKLYISLTKDEIYNVNKSIGSPTEIDIGNLRVLHEDVNAAVLSYWKDQDAKRK